MSSAKPRAPAVPPALPGEGMSNSRVIGSLSGLTLHGKTSRAWQLALLFWGLCSDRERASARLICLGSRRLCRDIQGSAWAATGGSCQAEPGAEMGWGSAVGSLGSSRQSGAGRALHAGTLLHAGSTGSVHVAVAAWLCRAVPAALGRACRRLSNSRGVAGTALALGHPAPLTAAQHPAACLGRAQPHECSSSRPSADSPNPAPVRVGGFVFSWQGAACQAGLEVEWRTGVTGLNGNSCPSELGLLVQQAAASPRAFIKTIHLHPRFVTCPLHLRGNCVPQSVSRSRNRVIPSLDVLGSSLFPSLLVVALSQLK